MIAHSMKNKERPWALTKEGPFMKLRKTMKAQNPKKKEKERNNNNNNNNNNKEEEEDLDSVRQEDMQQEEHQGPRTLMCPFEALRRGP